MKGKLEGWKDITATLRVGHWDGTVEGAPACIYVPVKAKNLDGWDILFFLRKRGWHRATMHLDGQHYRIYKGRIYARDDEANP